MRLFARRTDNACPFSIDAHPDRVAVQSHSFNPNSPKAYWWAQNGMVCCWIEPGFNSPIVPWDPESQKPEYKVLTWQEATFRLEAYVAGIVDKHSIERGHVNYYPEVAQREKAFAAKMADVCLEAKRQIPAGTMEAVKAEQARRPLTLVFGRSKAG